MGEYILLDRILTKIGTCEDLRYTTFPHFVEWLVDGRATPQPGNELPAEYLRPGASAYRFRFSGTEETDPFEAAPTFPAPRGFLLGEWEHYELRTSIYPKGVLQHNRGMAPHLDLTSPCPSGPDWIGDRLWDTDFVELWAMKPMPILNPPQLWTCIRCPWCGAIARLDDVNVALLVASWGGKFPDVAARIVAGYADITHEPPKPDRLDGAAAILWARWQAAKLVHP